LIEGVWSIEGSTSTKNEQLKTVVKRFLRAMTKAEVDNIGKRLNTLDDLSKIKQDDSSGRSEQVVVLR
jgi:hypothetical protein